MNLWERDVEIGEEEVRGRSISCHRPGPRGEGERLEMSFKNGFELGSAQSHKRCEESSAFRFSMARPYSRQMSCGASWT